MAKKRKQRLLRPVTMVVALIAGVLLAFGLGAIEGLQNASRDVTHVMRLGQAWIIHDGDEHIVVEFVWNDMPSDFGFVEIEASRFKRGKPLVAADEDVISFTVKWNGSCADHAPSQNELQTTILEHVSERADFELFQSLAATGKASGESVHRLAFMWDTLRPGAGWALAWGLTIGMISVVALMLASKTEPWQCVNCRYDLRGLEGAGAVCPECGESTWESE